MQSDSELRAFNNAVAHRVVRWWEHVGSDLYLRLEPDPHLPIVERGQPVTFVRISAVREPNGASLRLDVVPTIPASRTRNVSMPDAPIEAHEDIKT